MKPLGSDRLALVALLAVLSVGALANWHAYHSFVFEDAYITYRYADNLARGEGFVFNPGERVLGTSTPLYALVLAAIQALVKIDAPRASAFLFSAGLALIGLFGGAILRDRGDPLAALLFGLLVVAGFGGVRSFFGLETPFYSALLLASYWSVSRDRLGVAGLLGGLAFLTRHDAALYLAATSAILAWRDRQIPWRFAIAAAIAIAPWLVFAQLYFGSVFPNTLAAKHGATGFAAYASTTASLQFHYALDFLRELAPGGAPLRAAPRLLGVAIAAAGAVGSLRCVARDRLSICLLAFPLALWVGYASIGPPLEHTWHLLPGTYFALLFCFAAGSIALAENPIARHPRIARAAPWLSPGIAALAVIGAGLLFEPLEREHAEAASSGFYRGRTTTYAEMGQFLRETGLSDLTLMTAEPGYVAFRSHNPVIDAAGLVTPGIVLHRSTSKRNHLAELAARFEPDLLVPNISYPVHDPFENYLPIWSGFSGRALLMRRDRFAERHADLGRALDRAQRARYAERPLLEHPFAFDLREAMDRERWIASGGFAPPDAASSTAATLERGVTTASDSGFWSGIESPPFRIDFDALSFQFGASHPSVTARLVVDGQVVLQTTGDSGRPRFRRYAWPVAAWRGRIGVFEVIDKAARGGSGALLSLESHRDRNTGTFEDFERDTWHSRWESVFTGAPREPAELVERYGFGVGMTGRLAHSFGASETLAMRSKPFRIDHAQVSLLLLDFARGRDLVALEIDGKVVRTENGIDSRGVRTVRWSTDAYRGRDAVLVVRDADPDAERFVGVDEIRFFD